MITTFIKNYVVSNTQQSNKLPSIFHVCECVELDANFIKKNQNCIT